MIYTAYAGTCSVRHSKGIYKLHIDTDTMEITVASILQTVNGSYQCISTDGTYLYTVNENMTFHDRPGGGVTVFDISGTVPKWINSICTAGQLPCHISISNDGKRLYVSSYLNGWAEVYSVDAERGVDGPERVIKHQKENGIYPSVHCIRETPDGKYICVVDVTLHQLVFYETTSGKYELACRVQLPEPYDYRPRQIVFYGSRLYLITEFGNDIRVFDYAPQEDVFLHELQKVDLCDGLQPVAKGSYAACIRYEEHTGILAGSVRGINVISTYKVGRDGLLTPLLKNKLGINGIRDFCFTPDGQYVLAAGQMSDEIRLYKIDPQTGKMTETKAAVKVPSCVCLTCIKDGE